MEDKVQELYKFIQERYLWQFYSRTWDRKENINEILGKAAKILAKEEVVIQDTSKDKVFYAEAKMVADEVSRKFSWLGEMDKTQIFTIVEKVKDKLIDVTVTNSQNGELNIPFY
jgi:V-containing nitrogenase delta subunit